MLYLPDTNIVVYALLGREPFRSWFIENIKDKKISISTIVLSEYLSKVTESEEVAFKSIVDNVIVLPVDRKIAEVGARYRRQFGTKSKKVWLMDCLIAATCKVYGATLVTFDKKDYPMKDIKIINLE